MSLGGLVSGRVAAAPAVHPAPLPLLNSHTDPQELGDPTSRGPHVPGTCQGVTCVPSDDPHTQESGIITPLKLGQPGSEMLSGLPCVTQQRSRQGFQSQIDDLCPSLPSQLF